MEVHEDSAECINESLLVKQHSKGGFKTLPFIIGSQGLGTIAYWGMNVNMIIYLTKDYGLQMAKASNIINIWGAISNFTPILGAFIADSYVGRFQIIVFGTIIINLGVIQFWSTTVVPGAKPSCNSNNLTPNNCTSTTPLHLLLLFSSFGLMAIGSGFSKSAGLAFGADQIRSNEPNGNGGLESYFNWSFIVTFACLIVAQTFIVYIQDHAGWVIGFGLPVLIMFLSTIIFFMGSSLYIKLEVTTNLLANMAQVIVASWRKRHDVSTQSDMETIYHVPQGSSFDMPSDKLKFLNKACLIKEPTQDLNLEGNAVDSWSISTVDKVEELKSLINIIPLWSTGIILNMNLCQASFQVFQANSMDRHVFTSSFEIPAASFGIFAILSTIIWLTLYDPFLLRLASKMIGKSIHLSLTTRMGAGLIISILSLVVSAIVESVRLQMETKTEEPTRPMSALWLLPQVCLFGLAEGLMVTAHNEFFYSELPKSMSSVASTLYNLGMAIAGVVASFIVSVVDNVTRRGGKESWLSNDPNKGHYDYYYCLLALLGLLNYMYFLLCSRAYRQAQRGDK